MWKKSTPPKKTGKAVKIPVVFITDNNYAMPTSVAIISLLANALANTFYEIFVIGVDLAEEHINNIESVNISGQEQRKKVILLSQKLLKKYKAMPLFQETGYVSISTYVRFELHNILKTYNKVLYLDSDILIRADLQELFSTDISTVYAGVARDMLGYIDKRPERYFSAGVLLLNLEKIRKDKIFEKAYQLKKDIFEYQDQDILNHIFLQKTKQLSLSWNFPGNIFCYSRIRDNVAKQSASSLSELDKIAESPSIVHYICWAKPWQDKKLFFASEWINCLALAQIREEE